MKSFSELQAAVKQARTPKDAAGTFVDGVSQIVESNRSDPATLGEFANELRGWKQTLVGYISPH